MNYQVYAPPETLAPFVRCFWTLDDAGATAPGKQRILPDGCMEMIFHYGDLYRQYLDDGSAIEQPRSFIFGQITKKYIEIEPVAATGIVATRFHPGGLFPLLPVPVTMLENRAVSLEELFGAEGSNLEYSVVNSTGNEDRIRIIEAFLISKLYSRQALDNIVQSCVEAIIESRGQLGVNELAGTMAIHRRQIERRLAASTGISPKQLAKMVRMQVALRMLGQQEFESLTSLAYDTGYYDQAHFIREFKEFTGTSPKSFYAGHLRFAGFFATAE